MSTGNNEPDDQVPDETDLDKELQDLVDGKFHHDPGFGSDDDPYDYLDKDVVESHPIDPELRKLAKAEARNAPLPHPYYVSSHERNVFVRLYRRLRDLFRR